MEIRHLWTSFLPLFCQVWRVSCLATEPPAGNHLSGESTKAYDDLSMSVPTPDGDPRTQRSGELLGCEHLSVKGTHQTARIREIKGKDYTFFVRPKEDFTRLTFRLRLQNILDVTEVFDTQETVEVHRLDIEEVGSEWVKVHVQYYRYARMGPNFHALRVTVGANTQEVSTRYWWISHTYEGFLLSAEGGLDMIFNCSPAEYFKDASSYTHAPSPSSSWVWLLAGSLISLALMSFALGCIVWRVKTYRHRQQDTYESPSSLVYEEFDEEMLAKIQQKVEVLREGRAVCNNGKSNCYVIEMAPIRRGKDLPGTHTEGNRASRGNHCEVSFLAKKLRRSKAKSLQWSNLKEGQVAEENQYETLYPLDYSTPLRHDDTVAERTVAGDRKSRVKSWHQVSSDDHTYENCGPQT